MILPKNSSKRIVEEMIGDTKNRIEEQHEILDAARHELAVLDQRLFELRKLNELVDLGLETIEIQVSSGWMQGDPE